MRHTMLEKAYGEAGCSVDLPYETKDVSPREAICLNSDTWQIAPAKKKSDGSYDGESSPKDGWAVSRVPIISMNPYFRSWLLPVSGKG